MTTPLAVSIVASDSCVSSTEDSAVGVALLDSFVRSCWQHSFAPHMCARVG